MSKRAPSQYNITSKKEVEANQNGRITPTQYNAFDTRAKGIVGGRGLFNIISIAIIFFVFPFALILFFRDTVGYGIRFYAAVLGIVTYFIEIPFIWLFVRNQMINWELKEPRIAQADGTIVWRRNSYVAEIPNRHLLPLQDEISVTPGNYRFYYLPTTGRLLSAKRTNANIQLLRDALAQTNNFLVSALEANRKGSLAATQVLRLLGLITTQFFNAVFILIISIGLTFIAYRFLPVFDLNQWYSLIVFLIGFLITLNTLQRSATLLSDIVSGKVTTTDSKVVKQVEVVKTGDSSHEEYYYEVMNSNLKFEVSEASFEALVDEQEYRLYYTPRSKIMVAIEPK